MIKEIDESKITPGFRDWVMGEVTACGEAGNGYGELWSGEKIGVMSRCDFLAVGKTTEATYPAPKRGS